MLTKADRDIQKMSLGGRNDRFRSAVFQKLRNNPENPTLIRYQANILKEYGDMNGAADLYCKAASLFLEDNRIVASITLKLLQWEIISPTKKEFQDFILSLNQIEVENQTIREFLCRLTVEESAALFSSFNVICFVPDHKIIGLRDLETYFYIVVSGTLKYSNQDMLENRKQTYGESVGFLHQEDYFGDIYPFDLEKFCPNCIVSIDEVELLRISKKNLQKIFAKYPRIENCFKNLVKFKNEVDQNNYPEKKRGARRLDLNIQLGIEIFLNGLSPNTIYLDGYTKDISIGGICFIINNEDFPMPLEVSFLEYSLKNAKVRVDLPVEELKICIPGKVVWLNTILNEDKKFMAIGIQFEKISPKLKGILLMIFNSFESH